MNSQRMKSQTRNRTVIWRFLKVFLPIAIIVIGGGTALFKSETENRLLTTQLVEAASIQIGSNSIKRVVQSITRDLAFLAEQETLHEMFSHGEQYVSNLLERDWEVFSRTKGIYDQIRWLNLNGQEKVRVNYYDGIPTSVAKRRLQNKGERYYFTDTVILNKGEFFISPLDLNIEQGKIEIPLKPMLRIGTPVFSSDFQKQGIILVNFFGEILLKEFEEGMGKASSRAWFLNRDGYWLKGPSADLEWGFMHKRPEASLAHLYPDAWKRISASSQGQFEDEHGLWTFTTVFLLWKGRKQVPGQMKFMHLAVQN